MWIFELSPGGNAVAQPTDQLWLALMNGEVLEWNIWQLLTLRGRRSDTGKVVTRVTRRVTETITIFVTSSKKEYMINGITRPTLPRNGCHR